MSKGEPLGRSKNHKGQRLRRRPLKDNKVKIRPREFCRWRPQCLSRGRTTEDSDFQRIPSTREVELETWTPVAFGGAINQFAVTS